MAMYLETQGIVRARIIQEPKATNTVEIIRNSMELMDSPDDTVGIVANNFHAFRGGHIAKKQCLMNAEGIAADTTKSLPPEQHVSRILRHHKRPHQRKYVNKSCAQTVFPFRHSLFCVDHHRVFLDRKTSTSASPKSFQSSITEEIG